MSNDSKRISELGIITALANNDRVVVLTNPNTSAQTQTITLKNFANSLIANIFPIANSTQLGVIKIGAGLAIAANGVVTAPLPLANTSNAGVVIVGSGINVNGNGVISVTPISNTSQLNNDSGFINASAIPANVSSFNNDSAYINASAIPANVSSFNNDSGYITASNTANTGNITFTNNVISIRTGDEIFILGNNAGINMTSNDYVQILYVDNGSVDGTGANNISLIEVYNNEILKYIKHFDAGIGEDAWGESRFYANGHLDYVGITNAYSYAWDIGPATDGYTLLIRPSVSRDHHLGVYPSADMDIHLYEAHMNGAVTLGLPELGHSYISVAGPGGFDGMGNNANNITINTTNVSPVTIQTANGTNIWRFNSNAELVFPDTSKQTTAYTGVKAVTLVNTTSFSVNTAQEIILCDPNAAGNNITVTLPNTAANGKIFTVKNINDGGYDVYVEANGQPNIIELHGAGTFNTYDNISASGNVVSWVYYDGYYRVVSYG